MTTTTNFADLLDRAGIGFEVVFQSDDATCPWHTPAHPASKDSDHPVAA